MQVLGIAVSALATEAEQEYQAIETEGVGIPVTVAVERSTDPTCLVPVTVGPTVTTGAEDISAVDAVNMSVSPARERLTADVAITLATMYFPPSTALGTNVELV